MSIEVNALAAKSVASFPESKQVKGNEVNSSIIEDRDNETSPRDVSSVELSNVVSNLNSLAQDLHRDLLFSIDDKSGETIVKVVDNETDEVIREIPSKDLRELKARLEETSGIIFKDSV